MNVQNPKYMRSIQSTLIPFGIDATGKWQTADAVDRGLACECNCPGCGKSLIAKKGDVRINHFAHASNMRDGTKCAETAVHMYAKSVLAESTGKVLHLPSHLPYPYRYQEWGRRIVHDSYEYEPTGTSQYLATIVTTDIEHPLDDSNRRVDALVTLRAFKKATDGSKRHEQIRERDSQIIVEIAVTNPKDGEYITEIRAGKVSALEITVNRDDVFTEIAKQPGKWQAAIKRLILGPRNNRDWLYHRPSGYSPLPPWNCGVKLRLDRGDSLTNGPIRILPCECHP